MRFRLPAYSPAKFHSKTSTKIPKIIWQTNYTNRVTLPVYINYLFNRLLSLDWEYRHLDDQAAIEFVKEHANKEELEAYMMLRDGAAKADFFRLLALNKIGGAYLDIDATFCLPASKLIAPEYDELFLMTRHRFSNYFMASAPQNRHITKTISLIVQNIKEKRVEDGVYKLTGPTVLNEAIGDVESVVRYRHNRYTCVQGSFTNEHFQYLDKPRGKWIHTKSEDILHQEANGGI